LPPDLQKQQIPTPPPQPQQPPPAQPKLFLKSVSEEQGILINLFFAF
jgi:hypothetical protein